MTELEKAVMEPENTNDELTSEEAVDENTAAENALRESSEQVEKLKKEIEEESNRLDVKFAEVKKAPEPRVVPQRRYYYAGTISAAASLIFMGIAMTVSLFSPTGVLSALKVAPLMLVFLGLEVGFAVFRNRSVRLRYNVKSLILTVSLVLVTFIMSLISVNNSVTGGERYYAEERLQNMLEREISRAVSSDNIRDVVIEINLYGDDPADYENISDLKDSDIINLEVIYTDAQMSMYEFAGNCRSVMNDISGMPYNFGTVAFVADDDINSYRMEVNWLYQSDFSAAELVPLINYFGNDIVMDIPDLVEE